ncbi:MAG: hypothetical protein ACYDEN_10765 [Acidimicrobiales bacterium]
MTGSRRAPWRSGDVWAISLSAFFADLGCQAVLAGFPLFLVLVLRQPVWGYGLASALSSGVGALFSYAGDRIGHRSLVLVGNAVIPLLSPHLVSLLLLAVDRYHRITRSQARCGRRVDGDSSHTV